MADWKYIQNYGFKKKTAKTVFFRLLFLVFSQFSPYEIRNSKDIFNLSKDLSFLDQVALNAVLNVQIR